MGLRSWRARETLKELLMSNSDQSEEPRALRVLLVEDSETDAKLILRSLRTAGHQLITERVETAEQMRAALALNSWDIVLSDWSMPQFSARGTLKIARELRLDVPVIIVSGTVGEEAAVEAM